MPIIDTGLSYSGGAGWGSSDSMPRSPLRKTELWETCGRPAKNRGLKLKRQAKTKEIFESGKAKGLYSLEKQWGRTSLAEQHSQFHKVKT